MGEEIALENGRISDFHGLVTLTLTSDRVILHTVMHHSSTSTYIPNFIEIEETFCGRMDGRTDGHGHLRPTNVIRSTRRSRPKNRTVTACRYLEIPLKNFGCALTRNHDASSVCLPSSVDIPSPEPFHSATRGTSSDACWSRDPAVQPSHSLPCQKTCASGGSQPTPVQTSHVNIHIRQTYTEHIGMTSQHLKPFNRQSPNMITENCYLKVPY